MAAGFESCPHDLRKGKNMKTKIIQKENEPEVPAEVIAQSIEKIANAIDKMSKSGLTDKAIEILVRHLSNESAVSVRNVLWALKNLRKRYLK